MACAAAGRRPVRQCVVGDNQMQWSVSTMGAGGRPGLGLELLDRVHNVVFYWQRRRRGGGNVLIPTVPLLTPINGKKWSSPIF